MTNEDAKKLCLELIHADTEDEVVSILQRHGLWDDPALWRYYGDVELNWDRAGNQQARTDFVEALRLEPKMEAAQRQLDNLARAAAARQT